MRGILEVFLQAEGNYVGVSELQSELKLPIAKMTEEIQTLCRNGYEIETHPHFGYRMLRVPDRLTADLIKSRLKTRVVGKDLLVYDQTTSTSDLITQFVRPGQREGLVVFAESQTKGRGRLGRSWTSPRGKGLWFSVLLRPELPTTQMSKITLAACVAIARAVKNHAKLVVQIKWPNDLLLSGRKFAGILTEVKTPRVGLPIVNLGVGTNVNCLIEDFPPALYSTATSLALVSGANLDRSIFAAEVLNALDDSYYQVLQKSRMIIDEWASLSTTLGKWLSVTVGGKKIEGHAQGIDSDGALLVRKESGRIERLLGADAIAER